MTDHEVPEAEMRLVGSVVEGETTAVFPWGVIVDLGLSRDGLIDVLYIDDDDNYQVGDRVCVLPEHEVQGHDQQVADRHEQGQEAESLGN